MYFLKSELQGRERKGSLVLVHLEKKKILKSFCYESGTILPLYK